ncbi:MAG: DNA polymerase III subunit delta [Nitrospirae bacterium]|nr:DNA polymerase III subunit delta [Nitrospirota bacterium]
MSYKTFLKEIEKGLLESVYVIYTSESFLQREAIEAIKRILPEDERDFNLHIFNFISDDEQRHTLDDLLNVLNTHSFFGRRRFTISLMNFQKLSKKDFEKLNAYMNNPMQDSVFIIVHNGILKRELRERINIFKSISLDIKENEIPFWIKQKAKINRIEISDEAIDYLIGIIGQDLGLLSAEIEKISMLGKEIIHIDDISDIIAGGRTYNVFNLIDAIKNKDTEKVFNIYRTLKYMIDDYNLIGALNWHYGLQVQDSGGTKNNEYFVRAFEILNKVDIDIKSSGRNFPMEYLFVKLLQLQ